VKDPRLVTLVVCASSAVGVYRHAFLMNGGGSGGVSTHAAWKDCSTAPAAGFADLPKVPIAKELRRKRKRCASLESPSGKSPVRRIQAQRSPKVREKKEKAGDWIAKEKRRRFSCRIGFRAFE
jgi:hypothetical protein